MSGSEKSMTRKARRRAAREDARRAPRSHSIWRQNGRWIWLGAVALIMALGVVALARHESTGGTASSGGQQLTVGSTAPNGTFLDLQDHTVNLAAFRGKPTLLWFITTWCSSCQAGTQTLAQNTQRLQADGVHVVEMELYRNLGGSGPDIRSFAETYAGRTSRNPDWTWGTASRQTSYAYDSKGYLDIYYLLDARGQIRYINGAPASTMNDLLQQAAQVGT